MVKRENGEREKEGGKRGKEKVERIKYEVKGSLMKNWTPIIMHN